MVLCMSQVVLIYFAWVYETGCSHTFDCSVNVPCEITSYMLNEGNNTLINKKTEESVVGQGRGKRLKMKVGKGEG